MADRFEDRIYGTIKGKLRLELIREDLEFLRDGREISIWDAGCGSGHMAAWFAAAGHKLTCCDISYQMIQKAKERFDVHRLNAVFYKMPAQELASRLEQQDLVMFHAVIEWLASPMETLAVVADRVRHGGHLSLLFFNHHGLIYRNAMRGEWRLRYLLDESWIGKGKKLTPPHPQKPEELIEWIESHGFEIVRHTGIRVFYDYMEAKAQESSDMAELLELERRYCRKDTFRNMGRYIHLLARKSN
jgi:S-adenosylmethionine-dependent methyltransferase